MGRYLWSILLCSLFVVLPQAENHVFLKQENANNILRRMKRANSGFEEFRKGNLERECMEEKCSYEEAREVFENFDDTNKFWNIYVDGDQCDPHPCYYGGSCTDGIGSYTCLCLSGFEGRNCEIVIQQLCSLNNGDCDQFCKVREKTVTCSCTTGYLLHEDGKSCTPTDAFPCGRTTVKRQTRSVLPYEHYSDTPEDQDLLRNNSKDPGVIQNFMNATQNMENNETVASYPTDDLTRIIGGRDCKPGECPWQALLINEHSEGFCGGTILTSDFVLTAAHCMNQSKSFKVIVGEVDTQKKEGTESVHTVDRVFMHNKFVTKTYDNDIALIKLKDPITFSPYATPACIPDVDFANDVLMKMKEGIVSGFGRLHQKGREATILQVLQVPYIERSKCIESSTFDVTANMFCAGFETEVKDACQGDSGGPHVTPYKGTYFVTGVVSWGEGCAQQGKFGVYTKVSRFIKWIRAVMIGTKRNVTLAGSVDGKKTTKVLQEGKATNDAVK
ncbi:coagulation factor X [Microcaecilia unicolor]|uniref:coagulation factor Xa n=1 Tax=Microcaecilia unicolor TaxID=1415580 RepID=A0A6P7XPW2_9AMPH|nr:coagulation factor X [Microcaecilia unicolor]